MERTFNHRIPPAEQPAYKASEVAAVLGVPKTTIGAWCFGQGSGAGRSFKPLVSPADETGRFLSFTNLCELHVLAVIRRHHLINMATVRSSLDYVRKQLQQDRPLIAQEFMTNGVDLFIEKASQLINVSRDGQTALRGEFQQALARIDRSAQGGPVRLFPYSRISPDVSQQPKAVAIDPQISFGRPILLNAGVMTAVISDRFMAGDSVAEMAQDYGVAETDIDEALRFAQRLAA
ncbi:MULTISPECIES: DUF433 domain-containing protein [unclassified Variovorax]|uniref:DUF433 domain-containing protein n=1 Tax=unclassified Variovorax TaxID=663243 RepID=UPI002B235F10|nr:MULTISPECIES: DUF433 domain-containing protein [unclassified Variovorax]MEB0058609.1 DUF433 domain-containing protein [Variovorax sp. LG9.2]MEB0112086.1 DUF433 domain-containing protein [Variovorax sp. RTB1]